jgi:hypothetical protein
LRIGIVTTDVGTGSVQFPASTCVPNGEDGRLRGGIFSWETGDDPAAFAASVRDVVTTLGTSGCAFEQPLEAAARAISHREENQFPSAGRLFALIVVTDEEDCSVAADDAFFSPLTIEDANVYCQRNADGLTATSDLLAQIRGDRDPDEFLFAAITGVPVGLAAGVTPDTILADPRMQYAEQTVATYPEPVPACEFVDNTGTSLGNASPARRIVEFGALVPDSVLTTICTDDFAPAISEIAERIGARVPGVCLALEVPAENGIVPCSVHVLLPSGDPCGAHTGYSEIALDGDRSLCDVAQLGVDGATSGFYYQPAGTECAQLALTEPTAAGALVNAECSFTVYLELGEQCARASQCASGYCDPVSELCAPLPEVGESPPTGG